MLEECPGHPCGLCHCGPLWSQLGREHGKVLEQTQSSHLSLKGDHKRHRQSLSHLSVITAPGTLKNKHRLVGGGGRGVETQVLKCQLFF